MGKISVSDTKSIVDIEASHGPIHPVGMLTVYIEFLIGCLYQSEPVI